MKNPISYLSSSFPRRPTHHIWTSNLFSSSAFDFCSSSFTSKNLNPRSPPLHQPPLSLHCRSSGLPPITVDFVLRLSRLTASIPAAPRNATKYHPGRPCRCDCVRLILV